MFSSLDLTYYSLQLQHLVSAFGIGNVIATGLTIFIVLVNVIVYKLQPFSNGNKNNFEEESTPSTSSNDQLCQRFSFAEIKSATQDFKDGLVIGRGGFGKVYKGYIKNGQEVVAVKRLNYGSKQGEDEFWMEIESLSRLRHLHLVTLIGYCNEGDERILIYEYMPGGTVADHLYQTKGADQPPLSWENRLKICIGAARGLDYLHTGTAPGLIHRDVKDSNILLDDKFIAKIADFGLAKLESVNQSQSHVSTNVKGTFGNGYFSKLILPWQWLWEPFHKKSRPHIRQNVTYSEESSQVSQPPSFEQSIRIFSFSELMVATNNFRDDLKIGEGATGKCYRGWLAESIGSEPLVSIKRHLPDSLLSLEDFQNEMSLLKTVSHPNLLNIMGYCCEKEEFLFVHEFMKNGSLDKHLFLPRDPLVQPLSWVLRLKICTDVARGLAFMHSLERPIIHRNIKSSKVLLDESYNVKICGFGFARFHTTATGSTHVLTTIVGTKGYAAPEYVATGQLRVKIDVYSFGVILVEMLTGLCSFDIKRPSPQRNLVDWTRGSLSKKRGLRRIMDPMLEGQFSVAEAVQVAQLAVMCLSAQPKMRPSMREVLQTLEHIQSPNRKL
ncbi:hypothetical protein Leryth_023440 [Lithospermum erythrorhizon]|nr:hypothetical protein Leryth_023440 [Lithospermum erythrorhizon]